MTIQIDTSKLSQDALIDIAKSIDDEEVLKKLTEIATENINIAIINNPCASKELRHQIFKSLNYREQEKYLEHFCKNRINHDTIRSLISLISANFPASRYYHSFLLRQEDATIDDLNLLFELIVKYMCYEDRQLLLAIMIKHNNVDEALLTKIAEVSDELREKVLEREGVTITIHFNKEEE